MLEAYRKATDCLSQQANARSIQTSPISARGHKFKFDVESQKSLGSKSMLTVPSPHLKPQLREENRLAEQTISDLRLSNTQLSAERYSLVSKVESQAELIAKLEKQLEVLRKQQQDADENSKLDGFSRSSYPRDKSSSLEEINMQIALSAWEDRVGSVLAVASDSPQLKS